jgi:cyclophilin family peptidyl-prolyl cis-trans isomerase
MSNRKRSKKAASAAPANPNAPIQIAAIIIILLVVIGVIWAFVSSRKPAETAQTIPADSSCQDPVDIAIRHYDSAPPMQIDKSKKYTATVKMVKGGEFVIELYADKAPITVNSFVFLARQGYFNCLTFHRVLEGFMAQGGDPTGTGGGGPGYKFVNEDSDLSFDKAGVVAMANAGRDTNGSQFFITFGPQQRLDGGYTIFGQVTSGMDVVNSIRLRNPDQNPDYPGDAMQSVTITEE